MTLSAILMRRFSKLCSMQTPLSRASRSSSCSPRQAVLGIRAALALAATIGAAMPALALDATAHASSFGYSTAVIDALRDIHFKDYANAGASLKGAAAQGDLGAVEVLGDMALDGYGHSPDIPGGVKLLTDACQRGRPSACEQLGKLYDQGVAVPRDIDQAMRWYRLSTSGIKPERLVALERSRGRARPQYLGLGAPPDTAPPTCQAIEDWNTFVRDVYRQLDGLIHVPPISRHWGGAEFVVELRADGKVTEVRQDGLYGGSPPLGLGTVDALTGGALTSTSEYSQDQMKTYVQQIEAGIKSASALPAPPTWLSSTSIRLRYPYPDTATMRQSTPRPCPAYLPIVGL